MTEPKVLRINGDRITVGGEGVDPAGLPEISGELYSWGGARALRGVAAAAAQRGDPNLAEKLRVIAANHVDVLMNFIATEGYPVPESSIVGGVEAVVADGGKYGYAERITTTGKTSRWLLPCATAAGPVLWATADAYARWIATPPDTRWMTNCPVADVVEGYSWITGVVLD